MVIEPIVLTEFGDTLQTNREPVSGSDVIGEGRPWHNGRCESLVTSHTDTHYRLICKRCGTIVIVPNEIKTYDQLRQWCADHIALEKRKRDLVDDTALKSFG